MNVTTFTDTVNCNNPFWSLKSSEHTLLLYQALCYRSGNKSCSAIVLLHTRRHIRI